MNSKTMIDNYFADHIISKDKIYAMDANDIMITTSDGYVSSTNDIDSLITTASISVSRLKDSSSSYSILGTNSSKDAVYF